ncbi:MAG: hypothetical protein QXR26_08165 [Candidatus Caldarchaeum sp.]
MKQRDEVEKVVEQLKPKQQPSTLHPSQDLHEQIKAMLVEIGRLQGYVSDAEYTMDGARLDVVWRRLERAVPTYVFEVQVGGDLYHALSKLKHARDIWNSKIFLVVGEEDITKADQLLSGTFHEIRQEIRVVKTSDIRELHERKKLYKELERRLGLI